MPLPKRCCSDYCDHCCRCRGFLLCTLFYTTSRTGTYLSVLPVPPPSVQTQNWELPAFFASLFLLPGKGTTYALALCREGAGREPRGRCGCGAAMNALDPRGQQNTAGEAGSARGVPGLVTKGTRPGALHRQRGPGLLPGRSEGAAEQVRHTACLGKKGPTSWDQGSPPGFETSGHGNGAVPQADAKGMDLEMHSITPLCPHPGASWSTSGSALCLAIIPCAEEVCPRKHIGRKSVLVVFSASACQGSLYVALTMLIKHHMHFSGLREA